MGTRCLTVFKETANDEQDIAVMYRQFDGYPDGHGQELAEYLGEFRIVHGIPQGAKLGLVANGMGCLAAQTVAHFKTDVGRFYLYPSGCRNVGEDYLYIVYAQDGVPFLRIESRGKTVWEGQVSAFESSGVQS